MSPCLDRCQAVTKAQRVVKFRVAKAARDAITGMKQSRLTFSRALC